MAIRLTYFNFRARAELSRFILVQAGQEFEDKRIEIEEWPEFKAKTLCGYLPELECDGLKLAQGIAIARYLANKFGLAGDTAADRARADMIVDVANDLSPVLMEVFNEKDQAKKAELQKKLTDEVYPKTLTVLEKLLESNDGGNQYFVGKNVTWADLQVSLMSHWPENVGISVGLDAFPKLKALVERVESLPKIKQWIETRPATSR